MTWWSGLRARVAVNLTAAASLVFGLLALSSMAVLHGAVRDAQNAGLSAAADLLAGTVAACPDDACVAAVVERARKQGLKVHATRHAELGPTAAVPTDPVAVPAQGDRAAAIMVERRSGDALVQVQAPLESAGGRTRSALTTLVFLLLGNAIVLVVLGTMLLERGLLRRLEPIAEGLARIERFDLDQPFGPLEEGDAVGRMSGTLNRIRDRLRDDRQQTAASIAELKSKNRELRDTREGLALSERLATVGRLAAGVAHEIGNPVAAILGYLEILRSGSGVAPDQYLERIQREAGRIDRIVRDLLDFARPRPPVIGPVSLPDALAAAARLVQPQPRWRAMTLTTDVEEKLPPILAQEHYATQILVNLLMNAADACGGKGRAIVSAKAAGGRVIVSVADDGPGVPAADMERVFDPFFTTKPPGEGTGLGLAVSHGLMESFGGSIRVSAGEPKGAVFTLEFRAA